MAVRVRCSAEREELGEMVSQGEASTCESGRESECLMSKWKDLYATCSIVFFGAKIAPTSCSGFVIRGLLELSLLSCVLAQHRLSG